MILKVGDKVMLRENSRFNNGVLSNPLNVYGTIVNIDIDINNPIPYAVDWDNGYSNVYCTSCLLNISEIRHKKIVDLIG